MGFKKKPEFARQLRRALATSVLALFANAATADNVATVNVVQIFGTIDPAKVNDYTEYLSLIHI